MFRKLGQLMNHVRRFYADFNKKKEMVKKREEKTKKKKYLQRKVNGVGSDFIWKKMIIPT